MNNSNLTKDQKDLLINEIKSQSIPNDYISPIINNEVTTLESALCLSHG